VKSPSSTGVITGGEATPMIMERATQRQSDARISSVIHAGKGERGGKEGYAAVRGLEKPTQGGISNIGADHTEGELPGKGGISMINGTNEPDQWLLGSLWNKPTGALEAKVRNQEKN